MTLSNSFTIQDRLIGGNQSCFLIAEVAQSHDGSLGFAHSFIDAAADAGVDAIKFQTHIASAESTVDEQFRIPFSYEDKNRYDYWKRMEFTLEQWNGLKKHAVKRNIIFLSSIFSVDAAELMEKIGIPAWKIGSGEINNPQLLSRIFKTDKPILLSTGMSDWKEIDDTVKKFQKEKNPLALFQCTSKYPSNLSEVGLNIFDAFKKRYNVPVGLSDHSGTLFPSLAAMAKGSSLIEVHVTFHKSIFGPDVSASITLEELKMLAQARDAFHVMQVCPVDKNKMAAELSDMRNLFNKSVALKNDQSAGTILTGNMLTTKKPGNGIPASDLNKCIGKVLKNDVSATQLLSWEKLV